MFKAIIKAYSGESLHYALSKKLIDAKYEEVQYFLSAYIESLGKSGFLYSYQSFNQPVFRALGKNESFNLDDYK